MHSQNELKLIQTYMDIGWEHIQDNGFIGFIGFIGPMFQRTVDSKLQFCFPTQNKHKNKNQVLQGGALLSFCDRVLGMVARAKSSNPKTATIQLNMDFIHPVKIGDVIETSPELIKDSKHLLFLKGSFYVNSTLVAEASGIWKKIKPMN